MEIKSIVRGRFWETWATISGSEKEGGQRPFALGRENISEVDIENTRNEKRGERPPKSPNALHEFSRRHAAMEIVNFDTLKN